MSFVHHFFYFFKVCEDSYSFMSQKLHVQANKLHIGIRHSDNRMLHVKKVDDSEIWWWQYRSRVTQAYIFLLYIFF